MKSSMYNNFIVYQNEKVCYNVLNDKYVVLEDGLYELYQAAINEKNIDELQDIHPDFYNYMLDEKFIVPNEFNEFEEVLKLRNEVDFNPDQYLLFINPTMNCNFKCWYCYETHIKDSKMNSETIENVVKYAENIINTKDIKEFVISWFGGEPLLYFHKVIHPIMERVQKIASAKGVNLLTGFTTNGLLVDHSIIEKLKQYNIEELQITLDGYKENHDKVRFISKDKGSFDKIVENIILLADNKINVAVRVNCSYENINDIDSIMDLFGSLSKETLDYMRFTFHKVWQLEQSLEFDVRKHIEFYLKKGFNVTGAVYDAVRNSCYADKYNQAFINYNGDVFKCSARDFKTDKKEGILNNEGIIDWSDAFDTRMNVKYKNKPCQVCSILPVCGGGCSQVAMENIDQDYCVNDFDESKKNDIVYRVFTGKILN